MVLKPTNNSPRTHRRGEVTTPEEKGAARRKSERVDTFAPLRRVGGRRLFRFRLRALHTQVHIHHLEVLEVRRLARERHVGHEAVLSTVRTFRRRKWSWRWIL
eukprot:scaffold1616_cov310-Pinguiococcus_pyrenoidosus.AAC.30